VVKEVPVIKEVSIVKEIPVEKEVIITQTINDGRVEELLKENEELKSELKKSQIVSNYSIRQLI
jgi:hypothetical protein